jgi:hypothetical protein
MNHLAVECMYAVRGSRLELRIVGCPESQPAPRIHHTSAGGTFIYNEASPKQNQLRCNIRAALGLEDGGLFFPSGTNVVVELLQFMMPRPQYHFLSHRSRCYGNLKQQFKRRRSPVGKKPDIDNLEKFLFDSLEGVIFHDDKCIVQINDASKFFDSGGECKGCTIVKIVKANDSHSSVGNEMKQKELLASNVVVLDD